MLTPLLALVLVTPAVPADSKGIEFFETKIRPVLVEHCYSCHSAKEKKTRGGLQLDSRAALVKGGDTGPAVVANKPDESLLLKAIQHAGDLKMPPKGKLSDGAIADLKRWVAMGAPIPDDTTIAAVTAIDWTKARQFWSFQPVRRAEVPAVQDAASANNAIDRFLMARLEAEGMTAAAQADRRTLIRRVTFDLTGLPPTPEDVAAFVGEARPDAYERLVDRLLASPAFGERYGRHWLDVARYAEDQAHTFGVKPNTSAWRYRDWVVRATSDDLPFDRFVRLQIAADLMADARVEDRAALGFFGLGAQYYKGNDRAVADELDDRVDTLARGFLGLTVSCARCHDHKYDPVPTQDYYSLAGVFHSSKLTDVFLAPNAEIERFNQAQKRLQDAEGAVKDFLRGEKAQLANVKGEKLATYLVAAWKVQMLGADVTQVASQDGLDKATLDRVVRLLGGQNTQANRLAAFEPWWKKPAAGVTEPPAELVKAAQGVQERVLGLMRRGDERSLKGDDKTLVQVFFGDKGVFPLPDNRMSSLLSPEKKTRLTELNAGMERVKREQPPSPAIAHGIAEAKAEDLKVLVRGNPKQFGEVAPRRFPRVLTGDNASGFTLGSGRLELADAIATPNNPLTARVIVNRLWMHHFGRGLVNTPSNFGALGEKPTHPELLDWLASELVANGWSLKHVHRLIVTSAAYRRSGEPHESNLVKDPDNRLLWRRTPRRLDVEAWRDALLAASGQLERSLGGPTLELSAATNHRRTVYARISRHELDGLLRLFDFPDANITSEKRTETTVPQQQLFALNSPFVVGQAKALVARVQREVSQDEARVRRMVELAFGREALEAEVRLAREFLAGSDEAKEKGSNQLTRWERYAQVLLASNEFLYVD